jgi:Uncharacterized conserved protein (DUF2190)
MAGNRTRIRGRQIALVPTDGGVNPGDPCVVGQIPGVSLNGGGAVSQTIDTLGVYNLSVKGITTGGGNAAIAPGDILYYVPGDTPKLSKHSDGAGAVRFGYALQAVLSGATTAIDVRLGY